MLWLRLFLTLVLDDLRGELRRLVQFTSGEIPSYVLNREFGGPQS
jgi:hypothetical protein